MIHKVSLLLTITRVYVHLLDDLLRQGQGSLRLRPLAKVLPYFSCIKQT